MNVNIKVSAEKRFENILELAPDSIIIVNSKNIIELVNIQTEKLFGYTKTELIGKKIDILIPERHRINHEQYVTEYLKNPKVRLMGKGLELNGIRKDGSEFPVEISLSPMITDQGIWVSAAVRDISERKIAELKLKKYSNEMEQIVYIASHDLREPLLTIKNYFKILIEEEIKQELSADAKKYKDIIINASNRMEVLIKEILAYTRLNREIPFDQVDCNELLTQVIEDLSASINSSKAAIHIDNLPTIKANATALKLVFQNIINNSIKFRKIDEPLKIDISCRKIHNGWEFRINDNGIGMEGKNTDKIFKMFQKLHSHHEFEGTGIGLAHCKKIVDLHNGKIWVESELGSHSTFYFTILTENIKMEIK